MPLSYVSARAGWAALATAVATLSSGRADAAHRDGTLSVRVPRAPTSPWAQGERRLGLDDDRDGVVYVPRTRAADQAHGVVVMLHGAGGNAAGMVRVLKPLLEDNGIVLVAPESRGSTWDQILDDLGPDVAFIDRALAEVFAHVRVDPRHVAIAGFSDGASYALSLGLANGELFTHVVAFSPGFAAPPAALGHPPIFISHGVHDRVLPIASCSRRLVPRLRGAGYDVTYREFDDGHTVPADVAAAAVAWFVGSSLPSGPDAP